MNARETTGVSKSNAKVIQRVVICVLLLMLGWGGMIALSSLKKSPAKVIHEERPIRVAALRAVPENVPVVITGYGEVRALDVVALTPEVAGKIVRIHPRLEAGELIEQGAQLFAIDDTNYQAAYQEAVAAVAQQENTVRRLQAQLRIDKTRLRTLARNRDLAAAEYKRVLKLFETVSVGTRSGVDAAEQAMNSARDRADQMAQDISIYPIQIKETESALAMSRARLQLAKANLARCSVRAPFDGRVKETRLELGQYVVPGQAAVTLADDSMIEILVPLDSRDARQWLQFDAKSLFEPTAWFNRLVAVPCRIIWTEADSDDAWEGQLHRVVRFDQQTRTLTVAVRVDAPHAQAGASASLPLVEGMFCRVEIPGRAMASVVRLPRWAVSFQNTVYLIQADRLKTVPVKPVRFQGDEVFVAEGIAPGDTVVTTRLVDPLENALLHVTAVSDSSSPAGDS